MSEYCERADIETIYGSQNVVFFAEMGSEDNAATITARIAYFIVLASEEVDERSRAIGFQVPLVTETTSDTPTTITHITARLAGIMLYEALGMDSFSPKGKPNHKYWYQRLFIKQFWDDVKNSDRVIDALKG